MKCAGHKTDTRQQGRRVLAIKQTDNSRDGGCRPQPDAEQAEDTIDLVLVELRPANLLTHPDLICHCCLISPSPPLSSLPD